MAEKVVKGSDVKYSLVYIEKEDIDSLKLSEKNHHEIVGYLQENDGTYLFYSVEDNYTNAISDHWTVSIVEKYDEYDCWLLIKEHPCNLYNIMNDIVKGSNNIFEVYDFDVWTTTAKDCLVGVVTDLTID
jgi:hypothetical protein